MEMIQIEELKFDKDGLIPAIVIDADSGKVLTLAYMNRESLAISLEKKLTCFWSRSRQELWLKGETSGNYQHIVSITADCDADALLVKVHKDGPACHLGTDSCFSRPLLPDEEQREDSFTLNTLYELLLSRKQELPEGSYTSYLKSSKRSERNAQRLSLPEREEIVRRRSMRQRILPIMYW